MPLMIPSQIAMTLSRRRNEANDAWGMRARPERLVLRVAEGVTPSAKPPVRIFLGTEPSQHRAERIFIWSIERHRDPSRVYEIYLMKDLAGFDRRRWVTNFTNYRFAIPHFAGGEGRAIWNDVDQAYLADPAELFDAEMGDYGVLMTPSLSSSLLADSSVMLIDCARMAPVWTLEEAQHRRKNALLAKALSVPGLCGYTAPEWNARDQEYVPGGSKLLHWTILHTQPWRPLPRLFVYQRNPVGEVWFDLERSADAAGFEVFGPDHPSVHYENLIKTVRAARGSDGPGRSRHGAGVETSMIMGLLAQSRAQTVLDCALGPFSARDTVMDDSAETTITRFDRSDPETREPPRRKSDGVISSGVLDWLPDEDVPWVVEEMFSLAGRFVFASIAENAPAGEIGNGMKLPWRRRQRDWWEAIFARSAARHPEIHWTLLFHGRAAGKNGVYLRRGGRCLGDMPRVWVVARGSSEHADAATAIAEALDWPYEIKNARDADGFAPPWPDVAIAADKHSALATRRIGERSQGATRLVRLDWEAGGRVEPFDAVVTPKCCRPCLHPGRIETAAPLSSVTPERLVRASQRWPDLFGEAPHPRVLLVVGGTTDAYRLDATTARRLGEDARTAVQGVGGSVFAITHADTGSAATGALIAGLGDGAHLYWWLPGRRDNSRYHAYLAGADAIIVTGESEQLLAQAAAAAKPVHIYPLPERRGGLARRLREWVASRARAQPLNRRGTVRPQQSLEYIAARLIERGIVTPPGDPVIVHHELFRQGVARPFGVPLATEQSGRALDETAEVARQLRTSLGITSAGTTDPARHDNPMVTASAAEEAGGENDLS